MILFMITHHTESRDMQVRWTGNFKLPVGVNESESVFLFELVLW